MKRALVFAALAIFVALSHVNAQEDTTAAPIASQTISAPIISGSIVHKVIPKYPKELRKAKIEGEVIVQATVEPDGEVNGVLIVSGDMKLAEAAVDAVNGWKFGPYSQDGKPVKVTQNISFKFDQEKKEPELEPLPPPQLENAGAQRLSSDVLYRIGKGVSAPRAIFTPGPQYSEKAREANYQGICVLSLVVNADGTTRDIAVVRGLGQGLDEKAIEAVTKWKFEPGMKDGKPVAVAVKVEVQFRLYRQ